MSGISKACCSYVQPHSPMPHLSFADSHRIPPVVSKGYKAKGEYKTINGLKTC